MIRTSLAGASAIVESAHVVHSLRRSVPTTLFVLFGLVGAKVLLAGLSYYSGLFFATKIVDLLIVLFLAVFLVKDAGYFVGETPLLQAALLLFSASFFATELVTGKGVAPLIYELAKVLMPFGLLMALLKLSKEHPAFFLRLSLWFALACYAATVAGFFLLSGLMNRGETYLPAYFGGLHTSAYVMALIGILTLSLRQASFLSARSFGLLFAGSWLLVFVGWNVRTAAMMMLTIMLVAYWDRVRRFVLLGSFVGLIVGLAVMLGYLLWYAASADIYDKLVEFSSGRLEMWSVKLHTLAFGGVPELLFGQGIGSDFVVTDIWWWGAKDSHNDFLHILTEMGLVGFSALLLVFAGVYQACRPLDGVGKGLLLSYLVGSALSNGLLYRPLPASVFVVALCASLLVARQKSAESDRDCASRAA